MKIGNHFIQPKAKTELKNLKAVVCCNCVFVFLYIEIILTVSFSSDLKLLTSKLLNKHKMFNIRGHSIITLVLRGEGVNRNADVWEQRGRERGYVNANVCT